MSESFAERLSRFTPDASGLNRDALLFAAGRASVHPQRRWPMLSAVLAACWLLTFVALWPGTPTPMPQPSPTPFASQPVEEETAPRSWPPRTGLLSWDLDKPEPLSDEPLVPPEPPLRVFGSTPAMILN